MISKITALQALPMINLSEVRSKLPFELVYSDTDELLYRVDSDCFFALFRFGTVVFWNVKENEADKLLDLIGFEKIDGSSKEVVKWDGNSLSSEAWYQEVLIEALSIEKIRLILLNVAQSCALRYFEEVSFEMLGDTRSLMQGLENNGKLRVKGKDLKKYIGRSMRIKSIVAEFFYIFDSPQLAIEASDLYQFSNQMKSFFDLVDRNERLHDQLDIVQENLDLFKDIMFHKESSKMEVIIIVLILLEVIDLLMLKAINWLG